MLKLLSRILGLNSQQPKVLDGGFEYINAQQESLRLRLEHRAREDGAREQPRSEAASDGMIERQVIELGERVIRNNSLRYEQEHQMYTGKLNLLTPEGMLQDAQVSVGSFISQIESCPEEHRSTLFSLRKKLDDSERKLRLFRHDNRLEDRDAHYPESKILHFGFIFVLLFAESVLNASLLAQGNEFGLLGGWLDAVLFSVINTLVFGGFLAICFRWLHSVKLVPQLAAAIGLVLLLILVLVFNLIIAHFRNALGGDFPENAGTLAWQTFLASPFEIGDVKSLMLLGLGTAVALFAAADWFKMDDPYPGYGRVTRSYEADLANLHEYRDDLVHGALEPLHSRGCEIINDHLKNTASAASDAGKIIGHIRSLNDRYKNSVEAAEKSVNDLLQVYREANEAVRNTAAPQTFSQRWSHGAELVIHPVPDHATPHKSAKYHETISPLQKKLVSKYQASLKVLNEYAV